SMKTTRYCLMGLGLFFHLSTSAFAYDIGTHRTLGLRAATSSLRLDPLLTFELNLESGVDTPFWGKTPWQWIRAGAGSEDDPVIRVVNHFHNPLRPWARAGLDVVGRRFSSSIIWGQSPAQGELSSDISTGDGTWSWPYARQSYFSALTDPDPSARE